jgi:7-cyano-7-deazaguanine synthase
MGHRPADVPSQGSAVVLLSGGLDSATVLAIAHAEGWDCHALTVCYGQRHAREAERARTLAKAYGLPEHRILKLDLAGWGGSSLTRGTTDLGPTKAAGCRFTQQAGIPDTYVPARNTVLLSLALAWAEALEARAIFLGISAVDYSGYPDCRPEFLQAFQRLAQVATAAGQAGAAPLIRAPLLNKSKAETIRWGVSLGLDYALTWSCYDPAEGDRPCGRCESCRLRAAGFAQAGLTDPLLEGTEDA